MEAEEDIRRYKIKEAMVWKKSRFLKEWRERWVVLTENNLYSFEKKHVYRNPTQTFPINEILTLKLYHKEQQERPFSFRLESSNLNFYIACGNNQEKWSWVSAIERMIDRKLNSVTNDKRINEVINRSTFITRESLRSTFTTQGGRVSQLGPNFPMGSPQQQPSFKKKKSAMSTSRMDSLVIRPVERPSEVVLEQSKPQADKPGEKHIKLGIHRLQSMQIKGQKEPDTEKPAMSVSEIRRLYEEKQAAQSPQSVKQQPVPTEPKVIEKVVERIVDRIVEKKVIVQVKVPEIVQRIVEKIVYLEKKVEGASGPTDPSAVVCRLFDDILISEEDYRFFVLFVVELAIRERLPYSEPVLQVCLTHQHSRFFSEAFLQLMNREADDEALNNLVKFVILMYEKTEDFFYITDVKVLLDIMVRELQLYRSELSHFLILTALRSLSIKSSWQKLEGYRCEDLRALVGQVEKVSSSVENQTLAHELLMYIS